MNSLLKFSLLIILALCCTIANAQAFEGKIIMQMEALDLPPDMQTMKTMFESTITIYSKGDHSRMEVSQPMVGQVITLTDMKKKETVMCMDLSGKKMAIVSNFDDEAGDKNGQPDFDKGTFEYTTESKTIAGHSCKKAIWTSTESTEKGEQMKMEFWYAEDIQNATAQYGQLKGLPMEYTISIQTFKIHSIAREVSREKVANSQFEIPAGYERTTMEDMKKNIGGMYGGQH